MFVPPFALIWASANCLASSILRAVALTMPVVLLVTGSGLGSLSGLGGNLVTVGTVGYVAGAFLVVGGGMGLLAANP